MAKKISEKALKILRERFGDLSKITGDELRMFVAEVARSFIGTKEKSAGHQLLMDVYNEQDPLPRGYKMTLKDAWCAMGATAWSILAGVGEIVPCECSCYYVIEKARKMGIWVENEAKHKARVGDWCLFDWEDDGKGDNTGSPNHVGIVTERGENGFEVVDANNKNRVWKRNTEDNACKLRGFVAPDYDGYAKRIRESVCVAGFRDVAQGVYYQEALEWAKEKGIVFGVADGVFAPEKTLTRAEAVAMLYRAHGKKGDGGELPFRDIADDAWYIPALAWAWAKGIVEGRSVDEFAPDAPVLRCELVAMIWRLKGKPAPKGTNCPFADVPTSAWYCEAVTWAWEQFIVYGVTEHNFAPTEPLLRRDAVCMLHRWYTKVK